MILGLSGYIGSGKDTVAKMIQLILAYEQPHIKYKRTIDSWKESKTLSQFVMEILKPQYEGKDFFHMGGEHHAWEIKKFAAKLKQMCSLLTGIPVEDFEKQSVKDSFLGPEWDKWYVEKFGLVEAFKPHDWERQNGGPTHYERPFSTEQEAKDWWEGLVANGNHALGNPYLGNVRYVLEQRTVRTLLQKLGTDAVRDKVHQNAWVNALFVDYAPTIRPSQIDPEDIDGSIEKNKSYPNWIISDLRFPNETQAIKDRGGICIRIERGLRPDGIPHLTAPHESETALDNATLDYTIYNDGTIEQLLERVRTMLLHFKIIS